MNDFNPDAPTHITPQPPCERNQIEMIETYDSPLLRLPKELLCKVIASEPLLHRRLNIQNALMRTCRTLYHMMGDLMYAELILTTPKVERLLRCLKAADESKLSSLGGATWMVQKLSKIQKAIFTSFDFSQPTLKKIYEQCEALNGRTIFPNIRSLHIWIAPIEYDEAGFLVTNAKWETKLDLKLASLCRAKHICIKRDTPGGLRRAYPSHEVADIASSLHPADTVTFHDAALSDAYIGSPAKINNIFAHCANWNELNYTNRKRWISWHGQLFTYRIEDGDLNAGHQATIWNFYQRPAPQHGPDGKRLTLEESLATLSDEEDRLRTQLIKEKIIRRYPAAQGRINVYTIAESARKKCDSCGRDLITQDRWEAWCRARFPQY